MCSLRKLVNSLIFALVNGRYAKTVKATESYNHFLDTIKDDKDKILRGKIHICNIFFLNQLKQNDNFSSQNREIKFFSHKFKSFAF